MSILTRWFAQVCVLAIVATVAPANAKSAVGIFPAMQSIATHQTQEGSLGNATSVAVPAGAVQTARSAPTRVADTFAPAPSPTEENRECAQRFAVGDKVEVSTIGRAHWKRAVVTDVGFSGQYGYYSVRYPDGTTGSEHCKSVYRVTSRSAPTSAPVILGGAPLGEYFCTYGWDAYFQRSKPPVLGPQRGFTLLSGGRYKDAGGDLGRYTYSMATKHVHFSGAVYETIHGTGEYKGAGQIDITSKTSGGDVNLYCSLQR
ncbi:MAG: hypothetical protein NVS3B28_27810 [Candidatus Velthaea sp.]